MKRIIPIVIVLVLIFQSASAFVFTMFSVKPTFSYSKSLPYSGLNFHLFGTIGLSIEKALVSNPVNKGFYSLFVGWFPGDAHFLAYFGASFSKDKTGNKVFKSTQTLMNPFPIFVGLGLRKSLTDNPIMRTNLDFELKYFFNPAFAFSPSGLMPSIGLSFEFLNFSD